MGKQKIIRNGHSLAVTVPADFVKAVGIKAGGEVNVRVEPENGRVIYIFSGIRQLPLSQNLLCRRKGLSK